MHQATTIVASATGAGVPDGPRLLGACRRRLPVAAAVVSLFLLVAPAQVPAQATLVVTSTADSGAGTLRDAVAAASSGDSITFDPSIAGGTTTLTSGAVEIDKELTITGPAGGYSVSGNNQSRIFTVSGVPLTINGLTLTAGFTDLGGGGAIFNSGGTLTVENATLSGNHAAEGGAIFSGPTLGSSSGGDLTIRSSTLADNTAESSGGAIFNAGSTATITNSTLARNSADFGGAILTAGKLALQNSTLSANAATQGAAIYQTSGTTSLDSVTVAFNAAEGTGGAINNGLGGAVVGTNTIVADTNGSVNCTGSGYASEGNNLSSDATCFTGPSDLLNADPQLDPLGDNGGPTRTHAFSSTSPALDAGETALAADQRGVTRPQGAQDDIGAFERQAGGPGGGPPAGGGTPPPGGGGSAPPDDGAGEGAEEDAEEARDEERAPRCNGVEATIVGTPGDDTLRGTPGPDVIAGLSGEDDIKGRRGDDLVCGGKGEDALRGNRGDDALRGGSGRDECRGGSGKDTAASCQEVSSAS